MPKKKVVRTRRREKKHVTVGQAHIQSTFNNTVVSLTDAQGNVLAWGSAGSQGFKGSRKSTPFAAQVTAEATARRAMEHGLKQIEIFVKGPGAGREAAIRSLQAARSPTSRRSRITAAGLPRGGASNGQVPGRRLPPLPPRRRRALSERREVLHQVHARPARHATWYAHPGSAPQSLGLRHPAPRQATRAQNLLFARGPVPALLRSRREDGRRHWAESFALARDEAR